MTILATLQEHLGELQSRMRVLAWVSFAACLAAYLMPDDVLGNLLLGDSQFAFGRLTRLSWSVFGASLLAWPLWVYYAWRFVVPGFHEDERPGGWFFLLVLLLPYLTWYGSREYLFPWLSMRLGPSQSILTWLGMDAPSLMFRIDVGIIVLMTLGFSAYRRLLLGCEFLAVMTSYALFPPYLWAIVLLLAIFDSLWRTHAVRWRPVLLALPLAVARNEIVQGTWPWTALVLIGLGMMRVRAANRLVKEAAKAHQSAQPLASSEGSPPLVELEPEPPDLDELELRARVAATLASLVELEPEPPDLDELEPEAPGPTGPDPVGDEQVIQRILACLTDALEEQDPAIRCQAIGGLGRVGSQEEVELLTPFLTDKDLPQCVRLAAIEALGMLGGDKAVDALLSVSADKDLAVRWQAQEVLDCLLAGKRLPSSRTTVISQDEPLVRVLG